MASATGEEPPPAPIFLRMVAFAMDWVLVIFASLAAVQVFSPDEMAAGLEVLESYEERFLELQEAQERGEGVSDKAFLELQNSLKSEPSIVEMFAIMALSLLSTGVCYWFAGERFFGGSSLGKRMFSLASMNLRDGTPPGTGISLLRAFLKTIPSMYPLLALSYLPALFTRRRMAGHDYACSTMVIRCHPPAKEQEDSTNATL